MTRTTTFTVTTLALLLLAGVAPAQRFIPMNAHGKNYNEGRSNTAAKGIVAFQGERDNGDPVAGFWDWNTDTVFEMPMPTDVLGNVLEVVSYQFRPALGRASDRGQTIPGIDIIVKKTPGGKAAYWDTRDSDVGEIVELDNPWGVESWSTTGSSDGSVIGGLLYGDLSGNGDGRHAAVWRNSGSAELLPVPADAVESEVWGVSLAGDIGVGFKAINTKGVNDSVIARQKPSSDMQASGMIWDLDDGSYREISPGQLGVESLVLSSISDDASQTLVWSAHADTSTKAGLYDLLSDTYTALDAGDVNGDGQIDFADWHDSAAHAVSADGAVIGGSYTLPGGPETAAFWAADDAYQMRDLAAYLIDQGVSGLGGWHLTSITGVSPDGTVFSGNGIDPGGNPDVWVAVIPTPASATLMALGAALALRRHRR
jgi:hypothetical protein